MTVERNEDRMSPSQHRLAAQARLYAQRDLALPTDLAAALQHEGLDPDHFNQIQMEL